MIYRLNFILVYETSCYFISTMIYESYKRVLGVLVEYCIIGVEWFLSSSFQFTDECKSFTVAVLSLGM